MDNSQQNYFYVATRGHQFDIGGITPVWIPPQSQRIEEEGNVLLTNIQLVEKGQFREAELRDLLNQPPYPARNIDYNIADLKAQLAACRRGELNCPLTSKWLKHGTSYMRHAR